MPGLLDDTLPVNSAFIMNHIYVLNENSPIHANRDTRVIYSDLCKRIDRVIINGFSNGGGTCTRSFPLTRLFMLSDMILLTIRERPAILQEVMKPNLLACFLPCHILNVGFLSCLVGSSLDLSFLRLRELVAAALLHDIGMVSIDEDILKAKQELTDSQRRTLEQHPILGYQAVRQLAVDLPWLPRVVLEEHKRENGLGYPDSVKGEMHLYSKVIGLCDTFEALTHARPHRQAFHPADVMRVLVKSHSVKFHSEVIKAFLNSLTLYPVGSFVCLNNECVGTVVKANPGNLLRPQVLPVGSEHDLAPSPICLDQDTNLHITETVYNEFYRPLPPDSEI